MPVLNGYHYPGMNAPPRPEKAATASESQSNESYSGTTTLLASTDVSKWSNVAITFNNSGANSLGTVQVEFSPDNSDWEVWDNTTFTGLAATTVLSMQITGNSRKYIRIRVISQPTTATTEVTLHLSNAG